jgi:hypothetical protein
MRTERIEIRVTVEQRTGYDKARGDVPLSAWIRNVLDAAAGQPGSRKGDRRNSPRSHRGLRVPQGGRKP